MLNCKLLLLAIYLFDLKSSLWLLKMILFSNHNISALYLQLCPLLVNYIFGSYSYIEFYLKLSLFSCEKFVIWFWFIEEINMCYADVTKFLKKSLLTFYVVLSYYQIFLINLLIDTLSELLFEACLGIWLAIDFADLIWHTLFAIAAICFI